MRNYINPLFFFFQNLFSIKEDKVSTTGAGFWFFAICSLICLLIFQDIPDNLMIIVITLAITNGAVSLGSMGTSVLGAASGVVRTIKEGGGASEIIDTVAKQIQESTEEKDSSDNQNDST